MKSFKKFFSESYEDLDEQKMSFQDAEKLKNKHLIAMQHHKKSGNSKGYAAHSMVVSKFEDAYDHHGTGIIPAARILAASQKVFKDYPHSSMKEEVELEEKVAWSHKTYADYVAHNKAKGLQVIPKDLWHNLKKNPNQPSMKKEEVELDEELEFTKRVHSKGAEIHDIFHKGKFVGSIGKYFPRNGRPEGYHVLQYTSGREPKGSRGITRHERINSYDDAKKLVAKHFNIQEETELGEAKKPKPGHNASVMAKNISKVLSAVKKEEVEND